MILDPEAFRQGFERTLERATLIKLSDEDAGFLYGREDDGLAASLMERGVEIVILTPRKAACLKTSDGHRSRDMPQCWRRVDPADP